jgi:hypothetical protein
MLRQDDGDLGLVTSFDTSKQGFLNAGPDADADNYLGVALVAANAPHL